MVHLPYARSQTYTLLLTLYNLFLLYLIVGINTSIFSVFFFFVNPVVNIKYIKIFPRVEIYSKNVEFSFSVGSQLQPHSIQTCRYAQLSKRVRRPLKTGQR